MSEQDMKRMIEFDTAADKAGGYVSPLFKDNANYDYRKLLAYCKEKKIDPLDLTIRELDKFIIPQ